MIVHNLNPIFVDFGLFQIRWYSLAYIFGILGGWFYATRIINKTSLLKKEVFDDLLIFLILGIILGGRLGYVILYDFEFYIRNLGEIPKLWKGGMSFHGGLIGVVVSIILFSKNKKIRFFTLSDLVACAAPIGLFFGRIANFINAELYGKVSTLPWAVVFPNAGSLSRHPSQIYEALLEGILLFIIINFIAIKRKLLFKTGKISGFFLIFYSLFRIISEIFREPDVHLGYFLNYFSMGTILSLITFFIGCIIIVLKKDERYN